jgi:hypothetical protein
MSFKKEVIQMSRSGTYGFSKDGVFKTAFCQDRAFYEGLGQSIVNCIEKLIDNNKMTEAFDRIKLVDYNEKMTKEHAALINKIYKEQNIKDFEWDIIDGKYKKFEKTPKEFSTGDQYGEALTLVQGDLLIYIETELNIMFKHQALEDEEYAYIINLDTNCLEVYADYRDPTTQKVEFGLLKSIPILEIQQHPGLNLEYFMYNNDTVKQSVLKRKLKTMFVKN